MLLLGGISGSSPPARGAPNRSPTATSRTRIIPACAGSTEGWRCEYATAWGSSPPARGARMAMARFVAVYRIIPACAGSTWRRRSALPTARDHPRLRGEHTGVTLASEVDRGSSPPARGAQPRQRHQGRTGRIIPACAGSTPGCAWRSGDWWDHPRLRGEHGEQLGHLIKRQGSSPPARGAPDGHFLPVWMDRIIPACAGSTSGAAVAGSRSRDHPRLRGEHESSRTR